MENNNLETKLYPSLRTHNDKLRGFFVIFGGQSISLIGSNLVQFALVWWLTSTSGSAAALALASIIALLPQVVLGPFSGAFVDRWNRRIVMIVADALIAIATLTLVFLYAFNLVHVWHIYVLMFVRSLAGAFHWAAMQASTSLMVPEKQLARVAGLNQSLNALANIVAPPLGAILLAVMPIQNILIIDIGTAMLAIVPLLFVMIPQPTRSHDHDTETLLSEIKEGMHFLWKWRALRIITVIAMMINFLAFPAFSLLPIHVTNFFNGGALELAWLQSSYSIGLILGGITLSVRSGNKKRVVTALTALAFNGLGLLIFGITPSNILLLGIGSIFFSGFMNTIVNGTLMATLQAKVPPEKQGRVFSLIMSLSTAMAPLGLAFAGPIADIFGVGFWYTTGGIVIMLVSVASFFVTAIRINLLQLEEHASIHPVADSFVLRH
ncbi:MAG: MFS transporter [Candidatus Hermodarchaeia archaeon]|jgi:DHA3 family macrolide efflux protein-like MFS transporter